MSTTAPTATWPSKGSPRASAEMILANRFTSVWDQVEALAVWAWARPRAARVSGPAMPSAVRPFFR